MSSIPLPGADVLYHAAPCGLLLAAPDGQLLQANATLCRWLQYEPPALLQLRLNDLLTVGGRLFFHTHLQPLLRMQGSVAEVKLEMRGADGRTQPMLLNICEQQLAGGALWHIAVFLAEDRHRYERELLLQRQRAEELAQQHARDQQALAEAQAQAEDRALFAEQLVGMVSHDIRNPLSVIHMCTALIERGVGIEQQQTAVARIGRAVQRVQHLIADLLDFTQARLGRGLSVRPQATDLQPAMAECVGELRLAFAGRTIEFEASGDARAVADAERIAQAVGNLVANAVNHGAADRPVTVRCAGTPEAVRISVHNHGNPIAPELLPALFEPMVRGNPVTSSKGVGLGLFIVREIAQAHGGSVTAHSAQAEGTTFTIELPR